LSEKISNFSAGFFNLSMECRRIFLQLFKAGSFAALKMTIFVNKKTGCSFMWNSRLFISLES